ncbi:MAG: class I SAM-dependent methyltransferase [Geobacteraceae bacterium]|nr:class I SAM-dependent methyltransferase [Geobacteraceae bacterium]
METVTRDFNKVAATWDEEPRRVKLAGDIAVSIAQNIPLTPSMDVLDFGCGTGLLTLNLQPQVRTITGVDSSEGMLDKLRAKTERLELANVSAHYKNLDSGDILEGAFHLVTSCMTFHHFRDIESLLNSFYSIILPSGHIAIADLDLDDGQFHDDSTGVFHNGFDRAKLQRLFEKAGFVDVTCRTATSISKSTAAGALQEFTIFLMTARKI